MGKTERIIELIDILNDLSYHYYTLDNPKVSDVEYDKLYDELVELERETGKVFPYSPTQRIGGTPLEKFEKHIHINQLWSLDKSQSIGQLRNWDVRVRRLIEEYNQNNDEKLPSPTYVTEYKFDGLTINLTYENGELIQGATRGNGIVGEAILPQLKTIKSIPLRIPFKGKIEIQGEGLMPLHALEEYNKTSLEPLKNARNAAAGALRNLDPKETMRRKLIAYCYNVGYIEEKQFSTHMEMLDFLIENKLPVNDYRKLNNTIDEVIDEIDNIDNIRNKLDILTDGVVVKINDIRTREVLGYTQKFPRWAMAFKFEAEETTTKLLNVVWNVGRTGKVTPTAILEPVEIGGATVKRATLNNWDDIIRKKVQLNSRVLIRRSNEVIPEIMGIMDTDDETHPIKKPEYCPACGSELVQDGVHIFCPNSLSCKPQLVSRMVHFASRDAMNIEGLNEKTIEKLFEELNITDIPEIYELKYEDLINLEGFKEKKTNNLLNAIEKSKNTKLASFIYALGVPNVGIKTANDLANHYKSLENIMNAIHEELITIPDIGDVISESIIEFFHDPKILESIDKLLNEGVNPVYEEEAIGESFFSGKTVVITGSLDGYSRTEMKDLIEKMGGKVTGSVSSKTDYVVVGENPGSKYEKAISLGIEIIDQNRLNELL